MALAPIVLFTYNRPRHLMQTVSALLKNSLVSESEIFIFSDGPKNEDDEPKVAEVRKYIKTIKGFKRVEIIERDKNWGLASNIIDGITKVVNQYGKVIVLEDDIITSRYFLKYMNEALIKYEDIEKVMHIAGYMFPIKKEGLPDTFFLKPTSCWGWATWKRAWKFFERNPQKQITALSKEQIKDFNLNNSYDYWSQVVLNYEGKLHTWSIFWYLSVYLRGGLSLHPRESLTRNIGTDETGTHFPVKVDFFETALSEKENWVLSDQIEEHPLARKRLEEYFNKIKPPFWRRIASKILPAKIKNFIKRKVI